LSDPYDRYEIKLHKSAASLLPDAVTVARAYAAAQGAEQPPPSLKVAG
jgi:hypothetical protein